MPRSLLLALTVASALGVVTAPARARADEGARPEARALAEQGDAQFYAGRCDKATALWQRALSAYRAPTILLRIARCQALLGQVVAAAATLSSLVDEPVRPDAPATLAAFAAAREDGRRELPGVRARIASLRVVMRARLGSAPVTIEIDGAPSAAGTEPVPMDPGAHRVRVHAGTGAGATWEREIQLEDGEVRALEVSLWAEPLPPLPPAQRAAGLIAFGAGVTALGAGIGVSAAALSAARTLADECGPTRATCPPSAQGTIDHARAYSLAADGALAGGAVLVAAGVVLFTANFHLGAESHVRLAASPLGASLAGDL